MGKGLHSLRESVAILAKQSSTPVTFYLDMTMTELLDWAASVEAVMRRGEPNVKTV
ncbi:hypothetical protein YDYSY3_57910 [Paenibacillus chitinolyticus]|nr:hypothetical protein YDYSY3_57910 [Paenibacillus chitinolyticus]